MLTRLARTFFSSRLRTIERYATEAEPMQRAVLHRLLARAAHTEWGMLYGFADVKSYEEFAARCPRTDYEALKGYIDRMRHGRRDVLWPGQVKWYAKSSGTTNDKSKFIPVSAEYLNNTHYRGGGDAVALYLRQYPDSRLFSGKSLILTGSRAPNYDLPSSFVGDLSAILTENVSPPVALLRVPKKPTALLADFEEKRDRIARETMHMDIRSLSGVPSWMMSVLNRVLELTGKEDLSKVWPNLEVFFHGGVAFTPYREQYRRLIPSKRMHYFETYNASEGFFGLQSDKDDPAMLLMLDYGVFYEFLPMRGGTPIPLWEVETSKDYAMLISTACGLWRYKIGDTVRFTSTRPYKFIISGRTKCFINAFGEELMVDNAEKGLEAACRKTGADVREYTAAPVFMDKEGHCRHQWLIEFARPPKSVEEFADILDKELQALNSDYEAKRYKDLTLQCLEIIVAREGLFHDWLKSRGKLGGQHKVPRLSNKRDMIEDILSLQ